MSSSASTRRVLDRQLWLYKLSFVAAGLGGALAAGLSGSWSAWWLGSAATFFALVPATLVLALSCAIFARGLGARELATHVREQLADRDPRRIATLPLGVLGSVIVFGLQWQVAVYALRSFRTHALIALLLGVSAVVGLLATAYVKSAGSSLLQHWCRRYAADRPAWWPLATVGSTLAVSILLAVLGVAGGIALFWSEIEYAGMASPWWLAGQTIVFLSICAAWLARGLEAGPRWQRVLDGSAALGAAVVLVGIFGSPTNSVATRWLLHHPAWSAPLRSARTLTDHDGDGVASLLGGTDCAPFDERVYPGALDIPTNGIDENCSGDDYDGQPYQPDDPGYVDAGSICPAGDCNIVFITLDSFRADRLSFLGAEQTYMPHLEARARRGAVFANAYSPGPGTMTTVPCMLAGRFDSTLRMDPQLMRRHPVARQEQMLADSLQAQEVSTHAILEHRMLDPLAHGWTTFYNPWRPDYASRSTAALQVERILEVVEAAKSERFFIYAHLLETHHDFVLHPGFEQFGTDKIGRYHSELAYTDDLLETIFERIDRDVTARPTVVIVAGDHGEGFGEHGIEKHNEGLYRALVWVPLIVWQNRGAIAPRQLDAPVSLFDVAPTVRNLMGLPPRPDHVGISLVPALQSGQERSDRTIYNQAIYDEQGRYYTLVGITQGAYRLLHDMRQQTFELYDVAADPHELHDLVDREPERFDRMRHDLLQWTERIGLYSHYVHRYWERR